MMAEILEFAKTILPSVVALAAVVVSGVAISNARKMAITSTYFTEMTKAYQTYLDSIARFVYAPSDMTRDNLSSALYRVGLFASDDILGKANDAYISAIEWSGNGYGPALQVDDAVNILREAMYKHLSEFDCR